VPFTHQKAGFDAAASDGLGLGLVGGLGQDLRDVGGHIGTIPAQGFQLSGSFARRSRGKVGLATVASHLPATSRTVVFDFCLVYS
jgi:hypothetical protein